MVRRCWRTRRSTGAPAHGRVAAAAAQRRAPDARYRGVHRKEREQLKAGDDVARHVLAHNYDQTLALSLMEMDALGEMAPYAQFMGELVSAGRLDVNVEGLPDAAGMAERQAGGKPLTRPELMARIEGVHRPYHACLADTLAALRARWGAALLIDLHSMPPLPVKSVAYSGGRGAGTARVVLGDRFGGSCAGSLVATAFATLAERRMPAAHNRPYAGGFGLERHGAPSRGIHAVQVEVDRSCYLDSRLLELGEGFDVTVALLVDLVRRLAGEVAMLGAGAGGTEGTSRWPFAAE